MNEKVSQGKLKRACVNCLFLTEFKLHRIPDDFSVGPPLLNGVDAVHYEPYSSEYHYNNCIIYKLINY